MEVIVARPVPREHRLLLAANSLWNIANFRGAIVRALDDEGYDITVAAPATAAESVAFALPAKVVPLALNRASLNPLGDLALLWHIVRLLRRERPAAFLGWTIKPNIYGALAARMVGIPAILNVSGLGTAFLGSGVFSRFVGMLYRVAFARAAVVFFQNRDDRDLFVARRLVRSEQARLLPGSGIDLKRFAATPMPDTSGAPLFLLIARLLGDKGIREYVTAGRIVREALPAAKFQLLGPLDPDNRSAIVRAELDGWIAEGAIDYLGTTDDVRPCVAAAGVVVLPSYREGLPRTLLEGAAMGRPLIATDVPGCRNLIEDGVNGFLCAPRDAASLAAAMIRIGALDTDALAAMGQASRAIAGRFGEDRVVAAYVGALNELGVAP